MEDNAPEINVNPSTPLIMRKQQYSLSYILTG